MKLAICPGSFDPVTYGHLDIIKRSAQMVDKLIVAAFLNPTKHYIFKFFQKFSRIHNKQPLISNMNSSAR